MAQQRHHYERAFQHYLRTHRIPHVSVDEARKSLIAFDSAGAPSESDFSNTAALKSFDFVVYGAARNLLVDIKGRWLSLSRIPRHSRAATPRLESWVTLQDVDSLRIWQSLFGDDFRAAFLFVYCCAEQPPDGLFTDVFEIRSRWYALRMITLDEYAGVMRPRSARWGTVDVRPSDFERLSRPFSESKRALPNPTDVPANPRPASSSREHVSVLPPQTTLQAGWPAHRVLA